MGRSYRDLIAWQKSVAFVTQIYISTQSFPQQERFGLTGQLRRAAVSIPSNVAEGQARSSPREFHYFLSNARGSQAEIETQLQIAQNLGYLKPNQGQSLLGFAEEVGRLLTGRMASIKDRAA